MSDKVRLLLFLFLISFALCVMPTRKKECPARNQSLAETFSGSKENTSEQFAVEQRARESAEEGGSGGLKSASLNVQRTTESAVKPSPEDFGSGLKASAGYDDMKKPMDDASREPELLAQLDKSRDATAGKVLDTASESLSKELETAWPVDDVQEGGKGGDKGAGEVQQQERKPQAQSSSGVLQNAAQTARNTMHEADSRLGAAIDQTQQQAQQAAHAVDSQLGKAIEQTQQATQQAAHAVDLHLGKAIEQTQQTTQQAAHAVDLQMGKAIDMASGGVQAATESAKANLSQLQEGLRKEAQGQEEHEGETAAEKAGRLARKADVLAGKVLEGVTEGAAKLQEGFQKEARGVEGHEQETVAEKAGRCDVRVCVCVCVCV
jgi:hypothetical protein